MKKITIIPLSTPKTITLNAAAMISDAQVLYVQTMKHRCADIVASIRPDAISMDDLYDTCMDFDELNARIADRLTAGESCTYAVLGRGVGSALMKCIREAAMKNGFELQTIPAQGFAEAAMSTAVNMGYDVNMCEYYVQSAISLHVADTSSQLVIEEIDNILAAGELKLKLLEFYPDEHMVYLCEMDERGDYTAEAMQLYELDFPGNESKYDTATVLIVPKCELMQLKRHGLDGLMEVMYRLRAPGGCPWDAEQTHRSLRSSLIEESYEVLDAIDREDITALEEELGDLLLQVVFHSIIEEEKQEFSIRDVTTGIVNKLIYRHPHVFGEVMVGSSDDVLVNWERLKKKEKHQDTVADTMRAVPSAFPALMRSYKIQKKAANVGFDFDDAAMALHKVYEEADEVSSAIDAGDADNIFEEVGDMLFACVNVARLLKVDPELALFKATDKFMKRFIRMEELMLAEGKSFDDMVLDDMDEYWNRVKLMDREDEI